MAQHAGPTDTLEQHLNNKTHTRSHTQTRMQSGCLAVKDVDDRTAGNMTKICIWPVFDTNEANQNGAHSNRVVIGCVEQLRS